MAKSKVRVKKGITRRWLFNNLGIFLLTLIIIDLIIIFTIQNYYYGSAEQYMVSKLNSVVSVLSRYSQDASKNINTEIRTITETFSDKDKMELLAIDSKGRISLSSSGFNQESYSEIPDYYLTMDDYNEAVENGVVSSFTGKRENGERIMAVSYPISSISPDYSAIRIVASLSEIDNQIFSITIAVTLICLVILFLIGISGIYFIGSIVRPVKQLSTTASNKFAKGDFSARIPKQNNDEIGELCDVINQMAEELSKTEAMKNEFISSVSHELRTPLTAIKGWAETLSFENDPETQKKGIEVIINETQRLSQMVEELLDFSRIQGGHFTLNSETTDILAELGDAVIMYVQKCEKEGLRLHYSEPEMLPFVYGDKNRLRQVFINIIDNAIKYSRENGNITIKAFESGNNIVVSIADDGVGISKSDLPKIKTKFYKANHSKRGSGIGLAVADEIITMHGGTLELQSEENVGTTVTITLPAMKSPSNQE
ncbi:MAG: HAMP domain-containing histidine kinase [Oscillospiraceae bacterium]|nr:HAMP domain-containing histidine kinase [Oscillospiraceae bacterium]